MCAREREVEGKLLLGRPDRGTRERKIEREREIERVWRLQTTKMEARTVVAVVVAVVVVVVVVEVVVVMGSTSSSNHEDSGASWWWPEVTEDTDDLLYNEARSVVQTERGRIPHSKSASVLLGGGDEEKVLVQRSKEGKR